MKTEIELVLWALPRGEADRLFEQVMTATANPERIKIVQEMAARDGWHSFRVVRLGAPVFGRASLA